MFRLLILLAAVALAAWGLMWLADNPGVVTVTWGGVEYKFSLMLAFGIVGAIAVLWSIAWGLLRFVFRIPSLITIASRSRRREKGLDAVSRGLIAIGGGDARAASKHAAEASRLLGPHPMTRLLRAQAAQLAGDRQAAVAAYNEMLEHHETHGLGLRGLHVEARRGGDHEAALHYAARANAHAPAAWAGQAVLEDRSRRGDWTGALATVDSNAAARLIDKPTANRWRAVIKTAMAEEQMERDPKAALALAQEACRLAPTLVPAAAIYGRLAAASGDYRRATRALESAYAQTPHPDLAAAYLRVRHGDSAEDRLARARTLARVAPNDPESMLTIGRAALEAHEPDAARAAVAPLLASDSPLRPPDPPRLPFDGRHRGGRGPSGSGARVAWPRGARSPRQGLGGGRLHQRPMGACFAVGRARRLRLAHARRAHRRARRASAARSGAGHGAAVSLVRSSAACRSSRSAARCGDRGPRASAQRALSRAGAASGNHHRSRDHAAGRSGTRRRPAGGRAAGLQPLRRRMSPAQIPQAKD